MAYKALTYINLPFTEIRKAPGDTITKQELNDAQQKDVNIQELLDNGVISEDMNAPIHVQNIVPDPNAPTIQTVIRQAQATVAELEANGEEVPKKLRAVAELDYHHAVATDRGVSDDRNR